MKLGLVVPGFCADPTDWCIPALRNLVRRLATTDEVHVVALRYPYRSSHYDVFGVPVTALGGKQGRGRRSVEVWRRALDVLVAEHRRRRFDVLHAFWANETGALTALAGRLLRVPTIVSVAGGELVGFRDISYGGQLAAGERLKVRLALRLADHVTAGSRVLMEKANSWLRGSKSLHLMPLGVDLDLFRPSGLRRDEHPPRLIHVASLSPIKDQGTLLLAMAALREKGLAFMLEVVGQGQMKSNLMGLVSQLRLPEQVVFYDQRPHDELPAVYQSGKIFVLTSRYEAQCMAALEAAACGLPTVSTEVGIVPELAPGAAVAVGVGDHRALADAIAELLKDETLRAAMGQKARAAVEVNFSLDGCVERFHSLYSSLC